MTSSKALSDSEFQSFFNNGGSFQPSFTSFYNPVLYTVKQGDTLSNIITRYYDVSYGSDQYQYALAQVMYHNPQVNNPNSIRPQQLILLVPMRPSSGAAMCFADKGDAQSNNGIGVRTPTANALQGNSIGFYQQHIPQDPQEREMFWALSWMHENYGILSTAAGAGAGSLGGLVGKQNTLLIQEVESEYRQYKQGQISKGVYDYRRQQALKKFATRLGPFEKVLLNGQSARQAIQINRTKSLPATANITNHLARLNKLSKLASRGGVILTGAGVAMGCYDIANAKTQQEKNEIFVETAIGSTVSVAAGWALGAFLISNPVGWATILVLGTAAAIGSYAAGKEARSLYNLSEHKIDIVSTLRVDQICK